MEQPEIPSFDDIQRAGRRVGGVVRRTPVLVYQELSEAIGGTVFLKCENLQVGGAFKYRGATNAVMQIAHEKLSAGVATHSSGNHGAALALAARRVGVPAYVVVPENCAAVKVRAIREAGAVVRFCASTLAAREATVAEVIRETGATLVHPYDDVRVMAGQGTATLELMEEVPGLEVVIAPVSGGGLLGGTGIAAHGMAKLQHGRVEVYAAEPERVGEAAASLRSGSLKGIEVHTGATIADGLRAPISARSFRAMRECVKDVLTVSEEEIVGMTRRMWEETRLVVEPSAAVAVAVVAKNAELFRGKRVGVIVSGGNLDLEKLPWQK